MKIAFGLWCAAAALVPGSVVSAQFSLIDDFDDGNFDGWSLVDPTGFGSADASQGVLNLLSLAPLPGGAGFGTVLDASTVDPKYSNGVYRTTVSLGNDFNTGGIGARFSINQGLNFYFAFLEHNAQGGNLSLAAFAGGGLSLLHSMPMPEFDVGETWNLEFGLNGDLLSLSAWAVGDDYPGPLVDFTDAAFPVGAVGLTGGISLTAPDPRFVDVVFDDFQYAVPAPSSAAALTLGLFAARRRR